MRKLLKMTSLLTVFIMCFGLCGCDSDKNDDSKKETAEIITEVTTEKLTEPTTEMQTESSLERNETEQELFEKDETVVSLWKNGFSFENVAEPTINFIPETNTYVVLVPISSYLAASEFETNSGGEKWSDYVEAFTKVVNAAIDATLALKKDENINFRVTNILSIENPQPFISYENKNKVFDRYNAEESEKAIYVLKVFCDINFLNTLGNADVEYDSDTNNCVVKFYIDSDKIDFFDDDEFSTSFSEFCDIFEDMIEKYGTPTVTLKALEKYTEKPIYTVESGTVTYNFWDK